MSQFHRHLLIVPTAPDPSKSTTPTSSSNSEANFDTNMVIILAALLCALICALGLNSIVRCALRCSRRFSSEEETAARLAATTGLKRKVLKQLPISVYGEPELTMSESECPICLGEFIEGEKVRVLPKCNHGFHLRCIDTWLHSHSSCPNCRHSLLDCNLTTRSSSESTESSAASSGGNQPVGEGSGSGAQREVNGGGGGVLGRVVVRIIG